MREGVALGWSIVRKVIVQLKKCGYAMDRRSRRRGRPEGRASWVVEAARVRADVQEPRTLMKMTAGDYVATGSGSRAMNRRDRALESVRGTLWVV